MRLNTASRMLTTPKSRANWSPTLRGANESRYERGRRARIGRVEQVKKTPPMQASKMFVAGPASPTSTA